MLIVLETRTVITVSFAHPILLPLLLVPIALGLWTWLRGGHPVTMPFDHATHKKGRWLRWLINLFGLLPFLFLALIIILLAGPQQVGEPKSKRILTNIEFAVDVSGSMTAQFGDGDRYDAAMAAIIGFIDYREGDAFGLTVFGDDFLHWVPLTSDPSAIKCAPPFLSPRVLPRWFGQGTRIGKALEECLKVVAAREDGDRMIILLSDGYSFDLHSGNDAKIAEQLRAENIVLYTIHIDDSSPPEELYTMTSITGGQVFSAGDPAALESVFQSIDEMQETRLEKISADTMDHFRPWTLGGLGLLCTYLLSLFGLRYTPW